jgi:predicted RNA methylase
MTVEYRLARYKNLKVAYLPHLDGGGQGFGQSFLPVVRTLIGKVGRVFEFGAGPGFIGFSLLAHRLCESLCVADINSEAIAAAHETVRRNRLQDCVSVYLSDGLHDIPSSERWDLVVSNPPHFRNAYEGSLRHHDAEWALHRHFYAHVIRFLTSNASVLLQENYQGSSEQDFRAMISAAGLEYQGAFMHRDPAVRGYFDSYYFMWSRSPAAVKTLWPTSNSIAFADTPPEVIDVVLSEAYSPPVRIRSGCRTRFRFRNDLGRPATLWVETERFGIIPKFLRSFGVVDLGPPATSYIFQFLPGRYTLRDETSKRTVCRIEAL